MKKAHLFIAIFFISLFANQVITAQSSITAQELAKIMNNDNVVVVSARKAADYAKVHIKGAVNVDYNTLQVDSPYEGKLKSKEEIAKILGSKGITPDKKIVLYCKSGVNAGRVFWVLKYLGFNDVSMLEGQMGAWRAARKPVTGAPTSVKEASFTPQVNSKIITSKSYVKSKISSSTTILVDARKNEDFGQGHIGNAVNIYYKDLMTEDYKLKSNAEIKAVLVKAGVTNNKEVVLYCKSGTIAGLLYFILTEPLGYTKVKLYEGSYNEWKI